MKKISSYCDALLILCVQLVSAQFSRLCTDGTPAIFPCDQAALVCRPDPRLICEFYDGTAYCCADQNDPRLQTTTAATSTSTVTSTTTRPTSTSTAVTSTKLPTTRIIRTTRKVPTRSPVHSGCVDTMTECRSLSRLCNDNAYRTLLSSQCPKTCQTCGQVRTTLPARTTLPPRPTPAGTCQDAHPQCRTWVRNLFCTLTYYSRAQKQRMCAKSCQLCEPPTLPPNIGSRINGGKGKPGPKRG